MSNRLVGHRPWGTSKNGYLRRSVLLWVLLLAAGVLGALGTIWGQTEDEENRSPFWEASLPGGSVVVARAAVATLARTSFLVDGAMRVHEVSIGTVGSVQTRFYYLEAITPQSPTGVGQSGLEDLRGRLTELTTRVGAAEVHSEVLKTHPQTTHAHTVEFRLSSVEQLDRLYQHLERWYLRRGGNSFSLEESKTEP